MHTFEAEDIRLGRQLKPCRVIVCGVRPPLGITGRVPPLIHPNIIILLMLHHDIPRSRTIYASVPLTYFPGLSVPPTATSFDQPSFSVTLCSSHSKTTPSLIHQHVFDHISPFNKDQLVASRQRHTDHVPLREILRD